MASRLAGYFELKADGFVLNAVGTFTVNLGQPKRDALVSSRSVDGFSEMVQPPTIKGAIRDFSSTHVKDDILNVTDATITIKVGNGKTYMLENAWYSGDGEIDLEKAEIQVEFTGLRAEEMG